LVLNTTQKVYFYNYFGEPDEALTQKSYLYPYTGNLTLVTNVTSTAGVVSTVSRVTVAQSYQGVGSFNLTVRPGNFVYYLEFKSPDN
jgi:hypothetical protein